MKFLILQRGVQSFLCATALTLACSSASAAPMKMDSKNMVTPDPKDIVAPMVTAKDWSLEFGTGVNFSNVRNTDDADYTIVPFNLTASLKLDEVGNDHFLGGIFRGNTEFFFRGDVAYIPHGPESHYESVIVGPRYNFVQPNWRVIPYIEAGVGILFADSNPARRGLGQDFNFTFTTGAGAKYLINDCWFARLGVEYQHISNAGLSDPIPNNAIDAIGPKFAIGYSF